MMDTVITSVSFGQEQIQIQYMELENQSAHGTIEESMTLDLSDELERLADEIREALVEVVDNYKLEQRNPPELIKGNRFGQGDNDD